MFGKGYQVLDIDEAVAEQRRADIMEIIELTTLSSNQLLSISHLNIKCHGLTARL